jgi:hypothetical protein
MQHLMIDLETLSTRPDAAILSIGAVFFDIETGKLGDEFHCGIKMEDGNHYGHIDPKTVGFWLIQSQEAREDINRMTGGDNAFSLAQALLRFDAFFNRSTNPPRVKVWGNGAGFDPILMESAFRRCHLKTPWQFWMTRDVRTIVDLGRDLIGFAPKKDMLFEGTQHSALDDAIHQAKYVSAIYRQLQHCVAARP